MPPPQAVMVEFLEDSFHAVKQKRISPQKAIWIREVFPHTRMGAETLKQTSKVCLGLKSVRIQNVYDTATGCSQPGTPSAE